MGLRRSEEVPEKSGGKETCQAKGIANAQAGSQKNAEV